MGSSAYGRCHDGDVRIQAQDWCNITFTYGISLKDHVNVEVTDRCMNTITKDNLQYKFTKTSGGHKVSDIFVKEDNGRWSSWKQGFKNCYASR